MRRKLIGFLLLAALSFGLLVQNSTSQTAPSATLTLHSVLSTHRTLAGIDILANTEVVGIKAWAAGDSITWSLGYDLGDSWEIAESYESGGYSFVHARTFNPSQGIREGHVLTAVYAGTDSLYLLNAAPNLSVTQYYYGGYLTNMETTVAGDLEATAVPSVTFTIHPVSPYHSMLAGIDVSAPSDTPVTQFTVVFDEPMVAALTAGLPTPWYAADTVITNGSTTTISASVADPDSGLWSGHIIDIAGFADVDTVLITSSSATWTDSSGTTTFTFATTNAGSHFASLDSMIVEPPTLTVAQAGRDWGHSGVYNAALADTIYKLWTQPGFDLGGPVFWLGNRVLSVTGTEADSSMVVCRNDSTGVLKWAAALPDTAVSGYSWVVGGADTLVYTMRLSSETTENPIYALGISTGDVVWASASEHLVGRSRKGPQPFTIMSNGDVIAHDWADTSAPAVVRIKYADGTIDWSTILETNVVGVDTLDSSRKLATTSYNYNGTEYVVAVGLDGRLNILNATTGAFVDSTSAPSEVDTEVFLSSNSAFCDTLTPPVITMTTPYYDPASTSTFAYYAGYFNGLAWTGLVSDWEKSTIKAPYSPATFIVTGYDSLLHGPIIMRPSSTLLAYDAGRDVTNKSIATRPQEITGIETVQALVDTLQQILVVEPNAGLMQMFKNPVAATDSAGVYALRKWRMAFDPSPYARAWIEGPYIFLNAAKETAAYKKRVTGTTPPHGGHGGHDDSELP